MFIYLSKKIAIPNNTRIQCLGWNKTHGYIACGGDNGLLKVLKLDTEKDGKLKGISAPSNLSMNQTLEGHSGVVQVVAWNTNFQKLTSSDQNGLIIVWMLYKGSWYEEMINNRNKSVVRGMGWSADGQKICIVYDDGAVIVGSVDGNRIWGKELKNLHLSLVEWSPDGRFLLFGMQNGEVHVFEQSGNPVSKIALPVLQNSNTSKLVGIQWYSGPTVEGCATLAIGYDSGKIQLMCNESDDSPLILDADMTASCLQWNHDGTILAVTGKLLTGDADRKNGVKFFSPYGQYLYTLRVPGRDITACAWEGSGLRIALAVDSFIFFANIRPDYKWCYFANTVAYAFNKDDGSESVVVFWNVETNEKHVKHLKHLQRMTTAGEFCAIAMKGDGNQFVISVHNSIGTPVDTCTSDIEPLFLTANDTYVFAASRDHIFTWRFQTPKSRAVLEVASQRNKTGQERVLHVNDAVSTAEGAFDTDRVYEYKRKYQMNTDPICCITTSDKFCVVGRESGTFQRYSLPHMSSMQKHTVSCRPSKIALNCNSTRMSIIDVLGNLALYDFESSSASDKGTRGEQLHFERRDVWDVKWAKDNSELFSLMEKTRMYVFRNTDPEEPIMSSGYICSFSNLEVKAILLDEIMQDPHNPSLEHICNLEVKTLRDSRDLISKVGIEEAIQFIEDNSHPRLWQLLAEAALRKLDFETAEIAFVRCKDYQGIQFVKYIANLPNEDIRRAEVAAYFKQYDDAEKIYLDIDRSPEDCCSIS